MHHPTDRSKEENRGADVIRSMPCYIIHTTSFKFYIAYSLRGTVVIIGDMNVKIAVLCVS